MSPRKHKVVSDGEQDLAQPKPVKLTQPKQHKIPTQPKQRKAGVAKKAQLDRPPRYLLSSPIIRQDGKGSLA
jgi:hypothetical protein